MIVTIVHAAVPAPAGAQLASQLARLRAGHGRDVVLLDADRTRGGSLSEELERLLARHDDVVIDAGGDGPACRSALIAAQVALVPLAPEQADVDARYGLIARLNHARMFNPGLRVLFVAIGGAHDPAPAALCAMRAYAAQVMSAGVADTVLHLPDYRSAAEMAALYEEVYQAPHAPPQPRRRTTFAYAHPADGRLLQKQGTNRP
nr:ParA family protein [Massilia sp. JS1662]